MEEEHAEVADDQETVDLPGVSLYGSRLTRWNSDEPVEFGSETT